MTTMSIVICDTKCNGDEDQLTDCALQTSCDQASSYRSCSHDDDVGVSCSEYNNVAIAIRKLLEETSLTASQLVRYGAFQKQSCEGYKNYRVSKI